MITTSKQTTQIFPDTAQAASANTRSVRWLAAAALSLLLSGCAGFQERVGHWWPLGVERTSEAATAQDISAMEQVVRWLQEGEEARAVTLLEKELERNPNHRIAQHLMQQITADPQALLGTEFKTYQVQPGDSLSELAAEHLGDPLSFYVLARYNDIQVPRLLRSGQSIRLPRDVPSSSRHGPTQSVTVAEQPAPEPTRDLPLPPEHLEAENYLVAGRPDQAIALLDQVTPEHLRQASIDLLGEASLRGIENQIEAGRFGQAREQLTAARQTTDRLNTRWPWMDWVDARLAAAEDLYLAESALAEGDRATALAHFDALLAMQPDHPQAAHKREQLAVLLRDHHHESALILYRNQRLQEAIAHWQTALEIDPDHEASRVYLTRARELQRRLEQLGD